MRDIEVFHDLQREVTEGERVFMGKGRCAVCHATQTAFMDNNMHDLKLERFYKIGQTANDLVMSPRWSD